MADSRPSAGSPQSVRDATLRTGPDHSTVYEQAEGAVPPTQRSPTVTPPAGGRRGWSLGGVGGGMAIPALLIAALLVVAGALAF
ncbi:MAG TPA: hypothetical protein VGE72_23655 [Azospirillum sp.]